MLRSSKIINLEHSSGKKVKTTNRIDINYNSWTVLIIRAFLFFKRIKHLQSLERKKINGDDDRDSRKNDDDDEFNEDVFCSLNELRQEMTDMEEKLSKLQSKLVSF